MKPHNLTILAIAFVGLVAIVGLVMFMNGGVTGNATNTYMYGQCFDQCRADNCNGISFDAQTQIHRCVHNCYLACTENVDFKTAYMWIEK